MEIPSSQGLRLLWTAGKLLTIAYLTICLVLFFAQSRLLFVPDARDYKSLDAFNLPRQEVWLPVSTKGGKIEHIHGWWIPHDRSLATMLYLHGNGGNISVEVKAQRFHQLGFSVLLIDYRGYGRSEGSFPSEATVYQDAQTAWDYLVKERQISPKKMVVYGHSLGGAIAINLASQNPNLAGLIVSSSFTSIQQVAAQDWKFRLFPIELILTQKFDSIGKVRSLKMPSLFIHGMDDTLIPVSICKALYEAAPQPKQLLLIPQAGHNHRDPEFDKPENLQVIRDFAKRVVSTP
ncbi:MAG: alpha/beta hydrolase [Phormidesmis sp. CAN_BIN44]|nr:alpha/beta hydrolase [Phormidesmis sp. CAN_BIN44]